MHCHVPVFLEVAGQFHSTQPTLKAALACTKSGFVAPHLEVETYTWDVLPPELRQGHRADAIAREMRWVLEELALMAAVSQQTVSPKTLLRLGRVSNLPTVWTNVLAATVLAGGAWQNARTALVLVAMSLFYVGGMYLNDYFDRAIDARERPDRPIPGGRHLRERGRGRRLCDARCGRRAARRDRRCGGGVRAGPCGADRRV